MGKMSRAEAEYVVHECMKRTRDGDSDYGVIETSVGRIIWPASDGEALVYKADTEAELVDFLMGESLVDRMSEEYRAYAASMSRFEETGGMPEQNATLEVANRLIDLVFEFVAGPGE